MTAFWCRRLARKAGSSIPSTKLRASRAASSMSRSSAASRSGSSAIDRLGFLQDRSPTDEVPARFDGFAIHEIHPAPEQLFHRVLQLRKSRKIIPHPRFKCDKKIRVAALGIEAGGTGSRTKNLQPRDTVAPA